MEVYTTGQLNELEELLTTLPRYYRVLKALLYQVSVLQIDNFFVTPNFFCDEIEYYFLSEKQASDSNLVEPTITVSVFYQTYLDYFKARVFAENLPVFLVDGMSGRVLRYLTPCTEDKRLFGLVVERDNDGYAIYAINLNHNEICLLSFIDNRNFTILASILLQLQVTDVFCVDACGSLVDYFLDRQNVFYRVVSELSAAEIEFDQKILLKFKAVFFERSEKCGYLLSMMLREVNIWAKDVTTASYEFITADLEQYMKISAFDLYALDADSVYQRFAAYCLTDAGRVVGKYFFSRILCDAQAIELRQSAFRLVQQNDFSATLRLMPRVRYASEYVFHVQGAEFLRYCLLLQRCMQAYDTVCTYVSSVLPSAPIPEVAALLSAQTSYDIRGYVDTVLQYIVPNDNIFDRIVGFRDIFVNPNMSDELKVLFQQIQQTYCQMNAELDRFALGCRVSDASIFVMSLFSNSIVFTSKTAAYLQDVRECGAEILSEHVKSGIRFTSTRMRDLQRSFMDLIEQYCQLQRPLVIQLQVQLRVYQASVEAVVSAIGTIDFLQSAAALARQHCLEFPQFGYEMRAERLQPLHLVLNGAYSVHNSIELSAQLTFVTGANSGGKTTLLKAIAIAYILAQIGLPVPAASFKTRVFTSAAFVFCSGDDISRGKSTFLLEIEVLQCLIDAAGPNSLILIDEIGRGTSAADGFGISVASIEALLRKEAHVVAITHLLDVVYHFVQGDSCLAYRMRIMESDTSIQMLYEAEKGIDDSKGLRVARMCGFDTEMMDIADYLVNTRLTQFAPCTCSMSVEYLAAVLIRVRLGLLTKEEAAQIVSAATK